MLGIVGIIVVFVMVNFAYGVQRGIITKDNTLLRSQPSAASESLEFVAKGHIVEVIEEADVWVKIRWNEQEAYIRKNRIRAI